MITCRFRQVIELPGEAGVGSTLVSVAVGGGGAVIVTGVTDSPAEVQAVKKNSPINRNLDVLCMISIIYPSNLNTYG